MKTKLCEHCNEEFQYSYRGKAPRFCKKEECQAAKMKAMTGGWRKTNHLIYRRSNGAVQE